MSKHCTWIFQCISLLTLFTQLKSCTICILISAQLTVPIKCENMILLCVFPRWWLLKKIAYYKEKKMTPFWKQMSYWKIRWFPISVCMFSEIICYSGYLSECYILKYGLICCVEWILDEQQWINICPFWDDKKNVFTSCMDQSQNTHNVYFSSVLLSQRFRGSSFVCSSIDCIHF